MTDFNEIKHRLREITFAEWKKLTTDERLKELITPWVAEFGEHLFGFFEADDGELFIKPTEDYFILTAINSALKRSSYDMNKAKRGIKH